MFDVLPTFLLTAAGALLVANLIVLGGAALAEFAPLASFTDSLQLLHQVFTPPFRAKCFHRHTQGRE